MKAYILALAAAAALCAPASARDLAGGLKLGMNVSTLVGSGAEDAGGDKVSRSGLVLGGYLIFPVENLPFLVQTEALISAKGAIYKRDLGGTAYETRYRLLYLELPVLARFDFESRMGAKPSLLVGPSFGVKLSAEGESRTVGGSSSGTMDHIKGFDPGVAVGGLIEMETSRGSIVLEGRYTRSLFSIHDGGDDIRNSAASVMVGYRF